MIKITKAAFKKEARGGLYYFGSKFTDKVGVPGVLAHIRQVGANCPHTGTRRLLNDNNHSLKFETENGEYSYLDIHGVECSVFTFTVGTRKFFIVLDKVDDQRILTIYAKECTCVNGSLCKEAICIIDFAGNRRHDGFWADWCPNSNKVYFGGSWCRIPPMEIDHEPTEDQVDEYVKGGI